MVDNIGYGMPVLYDYNNAYNGQINPSTVHVTNTGLQWYFKRYLLQKAMAVFEWTLPESWNRDYFLYVLYCWGFIGVVNTDKFGVICQGAALKGYGVYYQPTHLVIANPLLTGILEPEIGTQAALIKLQPDYRGVMDRINFYADMLALSAETAGVDLVNSRLAYVFGAQNKQQAESFKKMFDGIAAGQPAQFVDKSLFNEDGTPNWLLFNQNIKNTYIAGDILGNVHNRACGGHQVGIKQRQHNAAHRTGQIQGDPGKTVANAFAVNQICKEHCQGHQGHSQHEKG